MPLVSIRAGIDSPADPSPWCLCGPADRVDDGATLELVVEALRVAFGRGWRFRVQSPIALDDDSEPEPDVAVVPGRPRDSRVRHPSRPALIVEVADTRLAFDRIRKGSLYARARGE
jgi:Uma2 family endonuclease